MEGKLLSDFQGIFVTKISFQILSGKHLVKKLGFAFNLKLTFQILTA